MHGLWPRKVAGVFERESELEREKWGGWGRGGAVRNASSHAKAVVEQNPEREVMPSTWSAKKNTFMRQTRLIGWEYMGGPGSRTSTKERRGLKETDVCYYRYQTRSRVCIPTALSNTM